MCSLSEWAEFVCMMALVSLPVMFVGVTCYLLFKIAREL